jgi:hypothetical protein
LRLLEDSGYIMAALGVLSLEYPREAALLMEDNFT